MQWNDTCPANAETLVSRFGLPAAVIKRHRKHGLYLQGDLADAVFEIRKGYVKLTVLSDQGKEAVVAVLGPGELFGESCLAGQPVRHSSATALSDCLVLKILKDEIARTMKAQPALTEAILAHVLSRNVHLEADLVDHLCNSCEQRLARTLLLLTHFAPNSEPAAVVPRINQETLAAMVGTTQPRISFLLSKFREKGLIEYGEGLQVNSGLLKLVLRHNCDRTRINETSNFSDFPLSNSE